MATPQVAVEAQRKRQQVEDAQSVLEPPTSEDVLEDPLAEEDLGEPLIDPLHESARGVQGDTPGDESPDPTPTPGGGDHLNPSSGMAGGAAAIQARGPMAGDAAELREQANKAVQGGSGKLPYLRQIQKAFGSHDISTIKAHTGEAAKTATKGMGAKAFAMGEHVVIPDADLHTAAHEAAHVLQQRHGVELKDGIGAEGDRYEVAADQVADAVVRGESVQGMLDAMVGAPTATASPAASQAANASTQGLQMCLDKTLMDPSDPSLSKRDRAQAEAQAALADRRVLRTPGAGISTSSVAGAGKAAEGGGGGAGGGAGAGGSGGGAGTGGAGASAGPSGGTVNAPSPVSGTPENDICEEENDKKKKAEETTTTATDTTGGGECDDGGGEDDAETGGPQEYTVEAGDSLSLIALAFYGSAKLWPTIYEANKATVGDNPNLIYPGQKLTIPEKPGQAGAGGAGGATVGGAATGGAATGGAATGGAATGGAAAGGGAAGGPGAGAGPGATTGGGGLGGPGPDTYDAGGGPIGEVGDPGPGAAPGGAQGGGTGPDAGGDTGTGIGTTGTDTGGGGGGGEGAPGGEGVVIPAGFWNIEVTQKQAAFKQRFLVRGTKGGDGDYKGKRGITTVVRAKKPWRLNIQNDKGRGKWTSSILRFTEKETGYVLRSEDHVDNDFTDCTIRIRPGKQGGGKKRTLPALPRGKWKVVVREKRASYKQRFKIKDADRGAGTYEGKVGEKAKVRSKNPWFIRVQNDGGRKKWRSSKVRMERKGKHRFRIESEDWIDNDWQDLVIDVKRDRKKKRKGRGRGRGGGGGGVRVADEGNEEARFAQADTGNIRASHATAAAGVAGSGSALPYQSTLEQAFGQDLSDIRAHTGAQAIDATQEMGANAYARGDDIALRNTDLFTVAHETAHSLQQREGVNLSDGFGRAGDVYERQADEAAAGVVAGDYVGDMFAEGGSGSVGVQMQPGDDAASTAVTHVCNSGESLTDISNHYYGTPHKWRLIFNANKDKLGSDMELSAGTVLVIPDAESGASGEDKGSSAKGTDESGDMPKVVPGDGNPDSTEALLKPKVDESPRKFGETVVEGDDANPFEAGKEGTEGGELDAASLQTPITGDAFTGSLTTVSWDSTQVNLGADHEQMDQVLTEVLGTNAKAIIEENKRTFEDLGAAIQVKQNELVGNISEYRSLMESSHGELRAHYTELHAQSQSTLADSFIKTGVFVDTVTEDQIQVMEARNKIFLKQIQNEEAERLTALQGAFATCRDGLKTYKGQWEGSYAQTVRAQAQVIRMSGDAYAAAAQQASVDEEGVAKKEAGKRGKAHAIAQARAQAGSATYKKYSPEFRKYAYMAADFLEKAAQSNVMLGDKLLAPTIDDLYPTEKKHVDQLAKHSLAEQHKVKDQVDKGTAGLKKVGSREVNNLGAEQKDAEMMLTVRRAHMNQRVENADLDLRGMYDKALGEASRAKDAFLAEASALANEEMNLIAPDKVQHAKDAAQEFAEERVDLLLDALSDDRDMALESLDEDRALQEQTMVDATASASEQIVATGNTIAEHQTSVTNTTVEQIDNAETQTQTVFQQVTDATANDAATANNETQVGAANFQTTVLERLNAYLQQASGQLESLREKMDSAATQSREAAQKAETKDIQSRVDKIAGATDRWGTDESALLTNMMGLSKAESGYLDTEFLRLKGKSLRSVILDETSKGDNVRESALAYLAGNATEGAKYAARYASDRWQNWFGTDTELLNKAMSSLTEEERDYLLTQDEDWPDLRDQLAKQLTEERTNSLFGANQYELDTFLTLTNKDIAYDDAHLQVKAIELTQAFQGTDNPFTWGTDEAKVWEVMEGLNGEDLEKFKALFAAYHGTSLEMELQDEMSGLELERGLAYANGDKALADMYGMEYALNRGKEQEAYEILEKRQNSGDWLDDAQNQQSLALTQAAYEQELGGKNGRAETLSGRIDQTLTEYTYETQQHGYGPGGYQTREISGISDTTDADLVQNMLSGKGNKAEEILYYAIRGAGTETAYVDKAIAAMKAELEQLSPEQRVTRMKEIKAYLKERGIDNPEEYLGIGQNKYDGGISELSGDQKNDLDQVWQQFEQDPSNVNHRYQRARDNYEWYRTKGATALGKAATDLYSDSGSDLDKRMARITSLYAEKGWYTPADGRVADSQEARDKWTYFKEQCELLDRQCKIYESTRDELADGICVVITTLVAIVTTVATLGAAMTVWAAALATFGAALLSVGLKAAIKGSGYSADDALKDVASAVLELAMQYVTLGMGKFAGVKKFFDTLDNGPLRNKVLSAIMQGAPGELTTALMDDKTWSSNADWGAIWGSFALKLVGQGVVGTTGAEGFKKSVGGKTGDLLADFFGNTASVVFDAKLMTSDNNEIAWALLKSWGTTAAANASAPYVRGMVARSLNRKWQSSNPTAADFERIRGLNQGAWGEVYDSFSDNVKLKIPRDLLDDQRANLQDQLRQTMGDAANEVATTIPTTVDTESTDDANAVTKKDDDVLSDDGPPVTGTGTGTGEAPPVIGDHVVRTLNEGSLEELMALGLTRHKAELIIAERETLYDGKKKPFTNISEAGERTHGVGDKTVDNLIAAEKRKMVQQETNSTINSQTFFDDLEALKKDFPKLSEHEVMKKVIWGEGPSGKRMFLSGTPIELDKLKQAGAFTRTMNLQEVYNYVLKNSAKVTLARQKIKNADDFGKAIANGTLDFNPEWLNSAMNLSGPLGWWALKQESTAVNAYQLEVDNATTPDKYKYGAIRFSITPDVAHTVGMQKPTAYDGMNFEEWTPETSGHTFGVTAGGKMEAVAPAVALGNATGVELFTQGGKKELATPTKLTTYEANTERVLKHIREGTKVPPVPKDLKDLYHSYGETGVHRQNGKTDETPKVRIEGEQLVIDAE